MRNYLMYRSRGGPVVLVLDDNSAQRLSAEPSRQLIDHAPYGFEWGYHGSGPAQLALAILLDFTGDADMACRLHQQFKNDVLGSAPYAGFIVKADQLQEWLSDQPTPEVES